ncbi:hypothetical protein D3C84_1213790 [compost metagenome]
MVVLGRSGAGRGLEQGNGLATHRVALDVFDEDFVAVGGEGHPRQVLVVDGGGIDGFVVHGLRSRGVAEAIG